MPKYNISVGVTLSNFLANRLTALGIKKNPDDFSDVSAQETEHNYFDVEATVEMTPEEAKALAAEGPMVYDEEGTT